MRCAAVLLLVLPLSCSEPETATVDPVGPYGDCSVSCIGWNWELDGAPACVCTPSCQTVDDCPSAEGIELECAPQDDPDPGRCVIPCDDHATCPASLVCHPVAGCVWPRE